MKTSATPKKIFSQKGQGLLEYALILTFGAAIALFVMINGGFQGAINALFGTAGDNVTTAGLLTTDENNEGENSFDYESQTADDLTAQNSSSQNFKPLNWVMEIIPFADMTYNTISRNGSVDNALSSEIAFFNTLFSAVDGHLASTNAADGTKDWESFLAMVESTKTRNNVASSYVRDEQKITIKKVGKDLRITYSDKESNYYYKLSPDANNVMQVETNSNKPYSQFFSSVMSNADGGGWQYSK